MNKYQYSVIVILVGVVCLLSGCSSTKLTSPSTVYVTPSQTFQTVTVTPPTVTVNATTTITKTVAPNSETVSPSSIASPNTLDNSVIAITAAKLSADYISNKIAADNIYLEKTLRITGKIMDIDKDNSGIPYITLDDDTLFSMTNPKCYFDISNASQVMSLSKGQTVTVQGLRTGKSAFYTQITHCTLIK